MLTTLSMNRLKQDRERRRKMVAGGNLGLSKMSRLSLILVHASSVVSHSRAIRRKSVGHMLRHNNQSGSTSLRTHKMTQITNKIDKSTSHLGQPTMHSNKKHRSNTTSNNNYAWNESSRLSELMQMVLRSI